MPLHRLDESELREHCRRAIESLEHWLRRLIVDTGEDLMNAKVRGAVEGRRKREPDRYSRLVDAALLDELIDIVCNHNHYKMHFEAPFALAFPQGHAVARTFLKRIKRPRNRLAHANPITVREAEQVICYSHDIIESLQEHYRSKGLAQEYNAPSIIRVSDSLGTVIQVAELASAFLIPMDCSGVELRPGMTLSVVVEVDPAFDSSEYTVEWGRMDDPLGSYGNGSKLVLDLEDKHVSTSLVFTATVTSNKTWHRMGHCDHMVSLEYRVLPPISEAG